MKYRKRPIVIEAFQMTRERREDNSEWPEWLNKAWNEEKFEPGSVWPSVEHFIGITTLEGDMDVSWGDWIIQGVQGELYPCQPDIFEATYEKVE